jgi:hypothetical protein
MQNDAMAEVIDLAALRGAQGAAEVRQVEAYWDSLRAGRIVPDRSEVDPRDMSGLLRHTFLLEKIAPGLARFRLTGRNVSHLMGIDLQGMPLSALFLPETRATLAETLSAVFDEPAVARLKIESPPAFARQRLAAEAILLPLRDDMGQVTRALGCLVAQGPTGRTPRRFTITERRCQTLIGYGRAPDVASRRVAEADSEAPVSADIIELFPRRG